MSLGFFGSVDAMAYRTAGDVTERTLSPREAQACH